MTQYLTYGLREAGFEVVCLEARQVAATLQAMRNKTDRNAKHLLGLLPGTKEDTASCRDFLRELKARGLRDPLLVVTDGAPGLIRATEEVSPRSLRQRCLAHKMRNLQVKVPGERWGEIGPGARAV